MNITPQVIVGGAATVIPQDPLSSNSYKLGLTTSTYDFAAADVIYTGTLAFTTGVTQYILDVNQGLITTPGSGASRAVTVGLHGKDADGETIDVGTIYYIGLRAPSTNGEKIDASSVLAWADGPLALQEGAASDWQDVAAGSDIHVVNAAGWAVASGDEIQFDSQGVGNATLQIVIIGKTTV